MDIAKHLIFDIGSVGSSPLANPPSNPKCGQDAAGLKREKLYKVDGRKGLQVSNRRARNREGQKARRNEALANRRQINTEDNISDEEDLENRDDNKVDPPQHQGRKTRAMSAAVQNRMKMLEDFRKNRKEKKDLELRQKKKPFLVGKVHYSTPLAELAKVSTGNFNFGGKTPKTTPSRVFVFKGRQAEQEQKKMPPTALKNARGKALPQPETTLRTTGRITRSRAAKAEQPPSTLTKGKKESAKKSTLKSKPAQNPVKSEIPKTVSSKKKATPKPTTSEGFVTPTPVAKTLKKPESRMVTPFPKKSIPDSDVDSEEERDVVPEVLVPITPRSTRKTPRRMGEVARLHGSLRPEVCFERGSYSDRKRKSGRKSSVETSVVPLEKELEDMDELMASITKVKSSRKITYAGSPQQPECDVVVQPTKLSFDDSPARTTPAAPIDDAETEAVLKKKSEVQRFRNLLDSEIQHLTGLCAKWEGHLLEPEIVVKEDVSGHIRVAVGKARILMDKKGRFQQFESLIDNCEFNRGEKETTCMDLQGFWDMIDFQVEDIKAAFKKLDDSKSNGWKEERSVPEVKVIKPKAGVAKKKPSAKPKGNLKALIAAKRKAMQNSEPEKSQTLTKPQIAVTFDGGFFEVKSPARIKTPARKSLNVSIATPARLTLRSNPNSPLAIMKVSAVARRSISVNPQIQQDCKELVKETRLIDLNMDTIKSTPGMDFSSFASASSFGTFLSETPVKTKKSRKSQKLDTSDLILFETPNVKQTPNRLVRRSARLSGMKTPSYK